MEGKVRNRPTDCTGKKCLQRRAEVGFSLKEKDLCVFKHVKLLEPEKNA